MVGDPFEDVRFRIEQSKAILHETEVAVLQSQQLLARLRENLAIHREQVARFKGSLERWRTPGGSSGKAP